MSPSAIELATAPAESQMILPKEEAYLSEAYLAEMWEEEEKFMSEYEANLSSEDDQPLDNIFSAQQQRLLVETLYTGWTPPPNEEFPQGGRSFWGETNIAVYDWVGAQPIVPDVFLSLDVMRPQYPHCKSYYAWRLGKTPDVVIEIVSNKIGGELTGKKRTYARMRVPLYVVFDPFQYLQQDVLQIFAPNGGDGYQRIERTEFPGLGLGLVLWRGVYEQTENTYLRWIDRDGKLLPTGNEAQAQAVERAERLAAKLRELGLDPEQF